MIDQVRRAAQQGAKSLLKSELGRKVLKSPQFQAAVMKAINTRAHARQAVTKQVQNFAKDHKLVTKADMAKLRRTVRELEATVTSLRAELEKAQKAERKSP